MYKEYKTKKNLRNRVHTEIKPHNWNCTNW